MADSEKQRETRQRRMVYEAVLRSGEHPDAEQIYLDVRAMDRRISKATVYRNLRILAGNGLVNQVRMPGADRFDRTTARHYHIQCVFCGTVVDAPIAYQAENDSRVEDGTGYRILQHRTVFEGVCPACRSAAEESEGKPISCEEQIPGEEETPEGTE